MNTLPLVSIICPCHNKASTIKATIDSIKTQTANNLEAIIINDSSTDNSEEVILAEITGDKRFRYEKVNFANVALVRNYGFSLSSGLYICPLDGDDIIAPNFLEVCIKAMQEDRSIAIAYTGLWYVKPDGEEGLSQWPGEWDYDRQLQGANQIPTCAVSKREVWERLGGQRARYCADLGAGSEDGEFYLRSGAYGFKAKKVTDEGLFIYSWMSGIVTGSKEYNEINWRSMAPYVIDGLHPFASYATPKRWSHAVSQYDEPIISIIIPVGPGHEKEVINALDSLEMQHFRKWEVIIVWDSPNKCEIEKAYPYARVIATSTPFSIGNPEVKFYGNGAGISRNWGVKVSRAPLLFFLDADDVLVDAHALDKLLDAWNREEAVIYSDYLGKAVWNYDEAKTAMGEDLLGYNDKTQTAVFKKQSADFDCLKAQRQPELDSASPNMPYYHWCLVSVLIPKIWHDEIGGFDESMSTWEDVDYFWRLARYGKCFYRVTDALVMYNYHKGMRREASAVKDEGSLQKHKSLIQYINRKYEGIQVVGCNCGQKRQTPQINGSEAVGEMSDSTLVMIEFDFAGSTTRDNFGQPLKSVTRQVGLDGKVLDYKGYARRRGERFLVHVADQRARPDMFRIVSDIKLPEAPKVELPEPTLLRQRGRRVKVAA